VAAATEAPVFGVAALFGDDRLAATKGNAAPKLTTD